MFGLDPSIAVLVAFAIFILLAAGVTLVLWIVMPFSVFGMKDLLKKLIEEQERTNRLLESMKDSLGRPPAGGAGYDWERGEGGREGSDRPPS